MSEQSDTVSVGIAIAHSTCLPGQIRSYPEIAAYCGCSWQNIAKIEARALEKVKRALIASGVTVEDLRHLAIFKTDGKRRSI